MEKGFDLTGHWRFELRHEYRLKWYTGEGHKGFDALVRIVWRTEGEGFVRHVVVDGERIDQLDYHVAFADVAGRGPQIESAVAEIGGALISEIAANAGRSE